MLVEIYDIEMKASKDGITRELLEHAKKEFIEQLGDLDEKKPSVFRLQKIDCDGELFWTCKFADNLNSGKLTNWMEGVGCIKLFDTCDVDLINEKRWQEGWTITDYLV